MKSSVNYITVIEEVNGFVEVFVAHISADQNLIDLSKKVWFWECTYFNLSTLVPWKSIYINPITDAAYIFKDKEEATYVLEEFKQWRDDIAALEIKVKSAPLGKIMKKYEVCRFATARFFDNPIGDYL